MSAPRSAWGDEELWDNEYGGVLAIPSSRSLSVSRSLRRMAPTLHLPKGARVLDAGSGGGRHALALAAAGHHVVAVDSSRVAVAIVAERAEELPASGGSLQVVRAHLGRDDVPEGEFDLVLDSYVSCHMLERSERLAYLESLLRQVRPGGALYTAVVGADDAYYSAHVVGERAGAVLATDPLNKITKLLPTRDAFRADLELLTHGLGLVVETFSDEVAGESYEREVLAAVVRRPR